MKVRVAAFHIFVVIIGCSIGWWFGQIIIGGMTAMAEDSSPKLSTSAAISSLQDRVRALESAQRCKP